MRPAVSASASLMASKEKTFPGFTPRELSVLELVAIGCTNIQIAAKLHISKYTVAQHIAKMLKRAGAANRTDLVSRAHIAGILADEPSAQTYRELSRAAPLRSY
jgi:DNA-binding NarL/FixJ family response regulator